MTHNYCIMANINTGLKLSLSIAAVFLLSMQHVCVAQTCITVDGLEHRYDGDVTQCTITNTSHYDIISRDTQALWIIYTEGTNVQLTATSIFPSLPNLQLLVINITNLNASDFQPGVFSSTDMPALETFTIVRNANADKHFILLDDSFIGLAQIENLFLDSLAINDIQAHAFRGLSNLRILSLRQNFIIHILPHTFIHTPNLTSLVLHNNYIAQLHEELFIGLSNLSRLDLSWNSFEQLTTGPFRHLQNIEIIDLSNNIIDIETGTFNGLTKLHYLAMNSNGLSVVAMEIFQDLVTLETLILDSNQVQLKSNIFLHLSSLRHISLSNNDIAIIEASHFNGLINLNELFLSNNLLNTIYDDTFSGLSSLTALDLDSNQIRTLEQNAFRGLNNLTKFSIQGNLLRSLPDGVFAPFSYIDTMYLHDNDWMCNCGIYWLIIWLRQHYDVIEPRAQWNYIKCGHTDPIPDESFFALIQQPHYLVNLCGLYASPTIPPYVTMETTTTQTTFSTKAATKPEPRKREGLKERDKIILSTCLIGIALVAVIVIIYFVHLKQRKNRTNHTPSKKDKEQQHNDILTKSRTSVPSFYPDPDSGHGSSTWEIRAEDQDEIDSSYYHGNGSPANGSIKQQHSYFNHAMDTASSDTLNKATENVSNFRGRLNTANSCYSVYSYEGEYYKDGRDQMYDPNYSVSMTTSGTPARVRTVTAQSIERNYPNSESSSYVTNSRAHSSTNGSIHYADIAHQDGDKSKPVSQSNQSTSAESDDTLLSNKNSAEIKVKSLPAYVSLHEASSSENNENNTNDAYASLCKNTSSAESSSDNAIELRDLTSSSVKAQTVFLQISEEDSCSNNQDLTLEHEASASPEQNILQCDNITDAESMTKNTSSDSLSIQSNDDTSPASRQHESESSDVIERDVVADNLIVNLETDYDGELEAQDMRV